MVQGLAGLEGSFSVDEWSKVTGYLAGLPEHTSSGAVGRMQMWALVNPPADPSGVQLFGRLQHLLRARGSEPSPGGPEGRPAGKRETTRQRALKRTLEKSSEEEARAHMRSRYTTEGTKRTYSSNTVVYREWCEGKGVPPYPTTVRRLETFAGYLLLMDGYKAPSGMISAIVSENARAGWVLDDPAGDVGRILKGLKRESPDPESGEPLGLAQFRVIFGRVRTVGAYRAALQLLGEHFTLLRTSSMQSVRTDQVHVSEGKVKVEWGVSKARGRCSRHLTFERVELVPPLCLPEAPDGVPREVRYCPVAVFTQLKGMAGDKALLCPYVTYPSFREALGGAGKPGILSCLNESRPAGRSRAAFVTHSARIGGCCTLLKAGMDPMQVKKMGDWSADSMVTYYGDKVLRDPDCVEAVRFYNPVSLAHMYTARVRAG
ncbi:hypothetical protein DIPPA_28347 [Diplonema papillatum]|nr:hypothetical protein DIPPA_28347 [Diplonema papillatum]